MLMLSRPISEVKRRLWGQLSKTCRAQGAIRSQQRLSQVVRSDRERNIDYILPLLEGSNSLRDNGFRDFTCPRFS
jgi:hypothetical protein